MDASLRVKWKREGEDDAEWYRSRLLDGLLDELMADLPALLLVGPRAAGKTTTALQRAASVILLDVPGEALAFRADPDAIIRGASEPVLLDEWQAVPETFPAVKRAIDTQARPGHLQGPGQATLAGRVRGADHYP